MDDLLDLSWSAAPPAPPQKPQPAFELLARPAPAASYSPSPSPSPAPAPAPPAKPAAAAATAHSDAFSSLIAVPAARAEQGKHMTMAEKQAAIAQEKRRKDEAQRAQFAADGAFWDSLGSRSVTTTPPPPPPAAAVPADPFDFDTFENTLNRSATASLASKSGETSGIRTPLSTLDFGDGDPADDLLGDPADDLLGDPADDLLGELGKPAPKPAQPLSQEPRTSRALSPPPHIVGQIVEMGFAPAQARQALAKTSTGVDVQEALDLLLGGAGPSGSTPEVHDVEYDQRKRQEAEKERRRRRRAGPSRESVKPRTTEQQEQDAAAAAAVNAQEQAERILAQASEIGQSMFNKATLFWNTSKERAIKVYEEQRKVLEAAERGEDKKKDARPKWMQDEGWGDERMGGFRDGDDEQDSRQTVPPSISQRPRQAPSRPSSAVSRPAVYQPAVSRPSPSPKPKPTPLPARPLIPATAQQLESSAAHKAKGNDHFKLGRFTEAESSYSSAIAALPAGNLFLIPLLNNRATTRLKLGDSVNAAADCTAVIDLVGIAYHPGKEASLPAEYAEIKLGDGLSKALVKRAQAWEMGEKWKAALEDWERVMGLDVAVLLGAGAGAGAVAKMRNMAAEGARRARKMMESGKVAPAPATPTPTATPTATPADVNRSAAVADLRKAAQALEAEEEARLKHKDTVDAKITNWKSGKETNLRALIASLDTVLWDDIVKEGGLRVGMHELVTDKQVKIKYMKVVARLHPDKLNTQNTTVEQRMLANGAFGVLSEAQVFFFSFLWLPKQTKNSADEI
ncbi:UBA/TS-N domain-containing protein [Cryptococcus neoformans Bt85]|nr:UBA/TS-N domain-containing protein [Cryptococcus neoformans var. grubii Bt85]